MVCKLFICSEFSDIPGKSWKRRWRKPANAECFLAFKQTKQKVKGLQMFAFSVVTVNDEHTQPRFKRRRKG